LQEIEHIVAQNFEFAAEVIGRDLASKYTGCYC